MFEVAICFVKVFKNALIVFSVQLCKLLFV